MMDETMYAMSTITNCYRTGDTGDTFWWSSEEAYCDTEKEWKRIIRRSAENKAARMYREYLKPSVRFFKSKDAFIKAYKKKTGRTPAID